MHIVTEFSPFVNLDVEMFPVVNSIFQTIGIKLIVKSDKATHMPSSVVETGIREDASYEAGGKEEQGISTISDTTSEVL